MMMRREAKKAQGRSVFSTKLSEVRRNFYREIFIGCILHLGFLGIQNAGLFS
jgi:hypothetical protein